MLGLGRHGYPKGRGGLFEAGASSAKRLKQVLGMAQQASLKGSNQMVENDREHLTAVVEEFGITFGVPTGDASIIKADLSFSHAQTQPGHTQQLG